MKESEANRGAIQCTLDSLSISNYVIKKGRPHDHRYGKTTAQREYHVAHNLRKRCIKRRFQGAHHLFVNDPELHDRDEEVCIKMDELFFFSNDELKTHKCLCIQITQHKLILTQQTDPPSQGRSRQLRQGRASQWATPPTNLQKTGRKTRRATETTVHATPMQQSGTWCVEHREPWQLPSFR